MLQQKNDFSCSVSLIKLHLLGVVWRLCVTGIKMHDDAMICIWYIVCVCGGMITGICGVRELKLVLFNVTPFKDSPILSNRHISLCK